MMKKEYYSRYFLISAAKRVLFRALPERLIALLRLLFSIFALIAVYVDPTSPTKYVDEIYIIFTLYAIYAAGLIWVASAVGFRFVLQLVIHGIDIAALSVAVLLTDGLGSPFFTFYTFTLFTATMRWGWRGALSTAAVLAVLFFAISWEDLEFSLSKDSQSNILIMRGSYLFVAAAMLGYFGAYMDRSRRRLARLAAWPLENSQGGAFSPLGPLRHAANVLGAGMVLVVWWDKITLRKHIAYWSNNAANFAEIETLEPWDQLILHDRSARYFSSELVAKEICCALDKLIASVSQEIDQTPLGKQRSFAFAPIQTKRFRGGVVIVDPDHDSEDIVSLGEIVAVRIGGDLERDVLTREVAEVAMAKERERVARDMHDSVLQDLTAAGLILKSALARLPRSQSASLEEVSWLLANQQRRIRAFVEQNGADATSPSLLLAEKLNVLLRTLERQWKCRLHATVEPAQLNLPGSLALNIYQLVSEATANAVRHGKATSISVDIRQSADDFCIDIQDDGIGMPTAKGGAIAAEPSSIRRRVSDLDGALDIQSAPGRTHLAIRIPYVHN